MTSPTFLGQLRNTPPDLRQAFTELHLDLLATMNSKDLNTVGTLLAHATPREGREARPITGDLTSGKRQNKAQEIFEDNVSTVGVEYAREIALGTV